MNYIEKLINDEVNITEEDFRKIRYVLLVIISEISKIALMFLFFGFMGKVTEYCGAIIVLLLIRTNTGGLHFNSYISCLVASFIVLVLSILVAPSFFSIGRMTGIIDIFFCIILSLMLQPIRSAYRDEATPQLIKKCHDKVFVYLVVFIMVIYIFSINSVIEAMIWTVNIQMAQLIVANIREQYILKRNDAK